MREKQETFGGRNVSLYGLGEIGGHVTGEIECPTTSNILFHFLFNTVPQLCRRLAG